MINMEDLREMLEEVKDILIKGYRQRGKENIAILIEQFDTDIMVNLVVPFIQAELGKVNTNQDERASL